MNRKTVLIYPLLALLLFMGGLALLSGMAPPASAQVGSGADLRVLKYSSPTNVVQAGEQFTYTIIVDNLGPDVANNIVITDTLVTSAAVDPNGCSLAIRTDGGAIDEFNCNFALSTGVFDLATLGSNHLNPRSPDDQGRIIATINATAEGNVDMTNITTVTSDTPDPDLSNNVAVTTLTVTDTADLRILKIASPSNKVHAGEQFTYTIIVDNLGPGISENIVVTDTLVTSAAVDANGCSLAIRTEGGAIDEFNCNFALSTGVFDLATMGANHLNPRSPSDPGRMIITINATADHATDMTNLTTVTADTLDPNLDNNVAITTLTVTDVADLAVRKSASAAVVNAGEAISWTVTVTNAGPSRAENVVVTDLLPAAVVDGSVTTTGANCTSGISGNPLAPLTCNLGAVGAGNSSILTISGRVDSAYLASYADLDSSVFINNDVRADSDTFDPDTGDNLDSASVRVTEEADLRLTTFAIGGPQAGERFHYEYDISNLGPTVARDVTLRDFLPEEVEFVDAFMDVEGGTGGVPLPCTVTSGTNVLLCPVGDIAPTGGVPVLVYVNVRVDPDVAHGTNIENNADVLLTDTPDPNTTNNTDSASVTAISEADLTLEKHVTDPTPVAGSELTYQITVSNNGPATALDVVVTDTLPVGITYLLDSLGCGASLAGCAIGDLAAGSTHTFEILVEVDPDTTPGTTLTNEAEVGSPSTDPDSGNNVAMAGVVVDSSADLRLLHFGTPAGEVQAGQLLTYTIFVDNFGPSAGHNVVVTDALRSDGSFSVVDVVNDPGRPDSCGVAPQVGGYDVTCVLGADLEPVSTAASGRWTLHIVVTANEAQSINATAHVTGADADPNAENNTTAASHAITDVADLVLNKTAVGQVQREGQPAGTFTPTAGEVTAGALVTYTLTVSNDGPSSAENVVLMDDLPAGLTVLTVHASQGSCTAGPTVSCGLGILSSGAAATVTVTARTETWLPAGTVLNNQAWVSSDVFDDDNSHNLATAPVRVSGSVTSSTFTLFLPAVMDR